MDAGTVEGAEGRHCRGRTGKGRWRRGGLEGRHWVGGKGLEVGTVERSRGRNCWVGVGGRHCRGSWRKEL